MMSSEKDKNVPVTFGDFIRAARKNRGLSMADAAKLLRCSKSYMSVLEIEPNQNPTIDTLANMAAVYGVDLEELTRLAAECSPDAAYRETLAPVRKRGK